MVVFVAIFWREDYRGGRNAVTHDCRSNTKYQAQIEDRGALDALKQSVFVRANHLRLDSELESAKADELSGENKKAIKSIAKALAWASNLKVDDHFAEKVRSASEWLANLKSRKAVS